MKAAIGSASVASAKPGLRSTEFWLAMVVALAGAIAAVYVESDIGKVAGLVTAALTSAGYGFSRARVKEAELLAPMAAEVVYGETAEVVTGVDPFEPAR